MKKLIIIFLAILFSCSSEDITPTEEPFKYWDIESTPPYYKDIEPDVINETETNLAKIIIYVYFCGTIEGRVKQHYEVTWTYIKKPNKLWERTVWNDNCVF